MITTSPAPPALAFDLQNFADTPERDLDWLWPGVIPRGMLALIGGKQGLGKSFLICDLAARISAGRPMPDGSQRYPGKVLLLAREDDAACVLKPRLRAAGADLSQVLWSVFANAATLTPMDLASHVELLIAATEQHRFDLIVVDTFAAFASAGTDANAAQDVRLLLDALTRLARCTGAAVVVVAHLRKTGQGDGDPMDAIAGSTQMTAGVRVASILDHGLMPGERWFRVVKSNLGQINEEGWTWRFAWPDAFADGAAEMPHLEWATAAQGYHAQTQHRGTPLPNPTDVREALLEVLATGARSQRAACELATAALRKRQPKLRKADVELAFEELLMQADEDVETWEGPRGAKMIGLPGSRPDEEAPEDRALRLAMDHPKMSVRALREQAGCQMAVAQQALRLVRAAGKEQV
ncbi:MAG: AAA family ATPase [Planctomycetota bacterium]